MTYYDMFLQFLHVLGTGVLSVTISRPISTLHRPREFLKETCGSNLMLQVVDQTVTIGTNGLRMPYCDKAQRRLPRHDGALVSRVATFPLMFF